ncbi:MAG: DUF3108 domain-containing protein [Kordiimonadaceae bacterium]|nr:DUF3108 domain-containing protein [Kordiimonadaceae bacterium]MBO6569432.1 DUF3108 domain-containing protein [Kordiimonadaceae bacterium]MBO6964907.1 DUF3108 domain-containing protein [Kordiimonadaceae bacterium]
MRFLLSTAMIACLAQGAAAADKITATYKFYWNGLLVSEANTSATIADEAYDFALDFRMRGVAKLFANGRSSARVEGALQDGAPIPLKYENYGRWDGKDYAQTMTFDADGGMVENKLEWPKKWLEEFKREPVPEDLQVGPDPASIVIALIQRSLSDVTGDAPYVVRSFDGDSVFDWDVSCSAESIDLEPSGKSPFAGAAYECGFGGTLVAGERILTEKQKKKAEKRRRKEEKRRAKGKKVDEPKPPKIWVQSFEDGAYLLPVRAEVSTGMGRVTMYLTDFSLDDLPSVNQASLDDAETAVTSRADGAE